MRNGRRYRRQNRPCALVELQRCCWGFDTDDKFNPIEFRPDSRLIVFSGLRNEKDGDDGTHFYRFDDGRFVHLRSVLKPNQ